MSLECDYWFNPLGYAVPCYSPAKDEIFGFAYIVDPQKKVVRIFDIYNLRKLPADCFPERFVMATTYHVQALAKFVADYNLDEDAVDWNSEKRINFICDNTILKDFSEGAAECYNTDRTLTQHECEMARDAIIAFNKKNGYNIIMDHQSLPKQTGKHVQPAAREQNSPVFDRMFGDGKKLIKGTDDPNSKREVRQARREERRQEKLKGGE